MQRSVLMAGLLGGLLGGVAAFAAGRVLKPLEQAKVDPGPTGSVPAMTEAREVADSLVVKLRAGKLDEFAADARAGASIKDEDFAKWRAGLSEFRTVAVGSFGPATGEFELLKETALSPSLFRFVYLERLERGGVWWRFVLYRGKDSWKLAWVDWGGNLANLFGNLS